MRATAFPVRGPSKTHTVPGMRARCVSASELATPHIDDIDEVSLPRRRSAARPSPLAVPAQRHACP